MERHKTVEEYLSAHPEWRAELDHLRRLMLSTELTETVKWGAPVYTIKGKNVIGLGAFKSYVGLWFYNGVFMKDDHNKLINAQDGVTRAMRQWRFTSRAEFDDKIILAYLEEAIENQKQGKEIKPERKKPLPLPEELADALAGSSELKACFEKMTPGKQREYVEYVAAAKRAETRGKRVEKIKPMILDGIGLNDKYR